MKQLPLSPVRYFDENDIYDYEVDNRPIADLRTNIEEIANALYLNGHVSVIEINKELEPAGGFVPYTCGVVDLNGRLSAIDIALPTTVINYSKYPIVMVLEVLSDTSCKCLSFSANFEFPATGYNKFLPDTVGRALRVGPGGSLVDEVYFDIYHADKNYQNITVGKILTVNSISFGGNQVNVLGDNRFLLKNFDDSSLGLVTQLRQTSTHNVSFRSILANDTNSLYTFSQIQTLQSDFGGLTGGALPVYFTHTEITPNSSTGNFDGDLEQSLNEVHFASPTFSTFTEANSKFRTAGINYGKLLDFSRNFLIHSSTYSSNIGETLQNVSTELAFTSPATSPTVVSFTQAPEDQAGIGTYIDLATGLPNRFFTSLGVATGLVYGEYHRNKSGAYIGYRKNTIVGATSSTDGTLDIDDFASGNSLFIHSKSTDSSDANLFLHADGYVNLYGSKGVFYHKFATNKYEVVNLDTLTQTVNSLSNAADKKVPLDGTTSENAIIGKLYFNLKGNATDTSLGLVFDSISKTVIQSSNPFELRTIAGALQIVRGASPVGNDDFATKGYVTQAITDGLTSGSELVVTTNTAQNVTGQKTFTQSIITSAGTPLRFTSTSAQIVSASELIEFVGTGAPANTVKLVTSPTVLGDGANTLTTKGFVLDQINTATSGISPANVYAIWAHQSLAANPTIAGSPISAINGWKTFGFPDETSTVGDDNVTNWFDFAGAGKIEYINATPGLYLINLSDGRYETRGSALPGTVFRTQTKIYRVRSGISKLMASNIHQDDTHSDSKNTLVGSSCSCVIPLQQGDVIYIASENGEYGNASIARIR